MHGLKLVGLLSWLITALGSIHVGLMTLGINVLRNSFVLNNLSWAVMPAQYLIGIAGVVSMLMLLMTLSKGGCCK